jgi:hypothetical protein
MAPNTEVVRNLKTIQGRATMAKFYVQSGSVRAVIDSVDLDRAALWVVNLVMGDVLPLDDMEGDENENETDAVGHHLSETIRISERGFDRDDAWVVDTLETFRHWYDLFQAVSEMASRWSQE